MKKNNFILIYCNLFDQHLIKEEQTIHMWEFNF